MKRTAVLFLSLAVGYSLFFSIQASPEEKDDSFHTGSAFVDQMLKTIANNPKPWRKVKEPRDFQLLEVLNDVKTNQFWSPLNEAQKASIYSSLQLLLNKFFYQDGFRQNTVTAIFDRLDLWTQDEFRFLLRRFLSRGKRYPDLEPFLRLFDATSTATKIDFANRIRARTAPARLLDYALIYRSGLMRDDEIKDLLRLFAAAAAEEFAYQDDNAKSVLASVLADLSNRIGNGDPVVTAAYEGTKLVLEESGNNGESALKDEFFRKLKVGEVFFNDEIFKNNEMSHEELDRVMSVVQDFVSIAGKGERAKREAFKRLRTRGPDFIDRALKLALNRNTPWLTQHDPFDHVLSRVSIAAAENDSWKGFKGSALEQSVHSSLRELLRKFTKAGSFRHDRLMEIMDSLKLWDVTDVDLLFPKYAESFELDVHSKMLLSLMGEASADTRSDFARRVRADVKRRWKLIGYAMLYRTNLIDDAELASFLAQVVDEPAGRFRNRNYETRDLINSTVSDLQKRFSDRDPVVVAAYEKVILRQKDAKVPFSQVHLRRIDERLARFASGEAVFGCEAELQRSSEFFWPPSMWGPVL